jgi:uncharacterized protein
MQFIVTGLDGQDREALNRRMEARPAHLEQFAQMQAEGKFLFAAAMLDDQGNMTGSIVFCDFKNRQELDAWLETEPYVVGNVWQNIDIKQCKVVPSCLPAAKQS